VLQVQDCEREGGVGWVNNLTNAQFPDFYSLHRIFAWAKKDIIWFTLIEAKTHKR